MEIADELLRRSVKPCGEIFNKIVMAWCFACAKTSAKLKGLTVERKSDTLPLFDLNETSLLPP
jgi:hypothetical protein